MVRVVEKASKFHSRSIGGGNWLTREEECMTWSDIIGQFESKKIEKGGRTVLLE